MVRGLKLAMLGWRLLDTAALLKATQGVARKHLALRRQQLDTYSKTSSLAKAVKIRTDRVTLKIRAASALNQRFNASSYSTQEQGAQESKNEIQVPSEESARGQPSTGEKQGLEQDHFYKRSKSNSTTDPIPTGKLEVQQEQAKRKPLPDGSIPPAGSDASLSERGQNGFLEPQRPSPPKRPTAEDDEKADGALQPKSSSRTSIPLPAKEIPGMSDNRARELQREYEDQIPSKSAEPSHTRELDLKEESSRLGFNQDKDVFYSSASTASPVLSALPRVKVPQMTEDTQESDEHVSDDQINQDVYYSSTSEQKTPILPEAQAMPEQDVPLEGLYSEIFHSPRVAKLLGSKSYQNEMPKGLTLPGADHAPLEQTKNTDSNDLDTFNSRRLRGETPGAAPGTDEPIAREDSTRSVDKDVPKLAADIAEEAEIRTSKPSEVSPNQTMDVIYTD